jgi:hypothetical protein
MPHAPQGAIPPAWLELQLCQMYHCRPSELDEEDWARVTLHRDLLDAYHEIQNKKPDHVVPPAPPRFGGK